MLAGWDESIKSIAGLGEGRKSKVGSVKDMKSIDY
jgi:hypothetical protein